MALRFLVVPHLECLLLAGSESMIMPICPCETCKVKCSHMYTGHHECFSCSHDVSHSHKDVKKLMHSMECSQPWRHIANVKLAGERHE